MLYSDKDIIELLQNGVIKIDPLPFLPYALGSCSVDLRLQGNPCSPNDKGYTKEVEYVYTDRFGVRLTGIMLTENRDDHWDIVIPAHGFVLAATLETVTLPNHIVGHLHGRSSLAREGVGVHITAGIIDAGWSGKIVLELVNHSDQPVTLQHSQRVCALTFEALSSPTTRPYNQRENAKYKGQDGVIGSRLEQDKE